MININVKFTPYIYVEQAANSSIWTLSSDSESSPGHSPKRKEKISLSQESGEANDPVLTGRGGESPRKKTSKGKSPKKGLKVGGQTPEMENNVNDDGKITGMILDL